MFHTFEELQTMVRENKPKQNREKAREIVESHESFKTNPNATKEALEKALKVSHKKRIEALGLVLIQGGKSE